MTMEKIDPEFRKKLRSIEGGELLSYCYQCGICVADCPAARYSPDFNPRVILERAALGLKESILQEVSGIWKCTSCYTCDERCPQGVHPMRVLALLKCILAQEGKAPKEVIERVDNIRRTGRVVVITETVDKRRKELGLESLKPVPVEEIKRMLEVTK